MKKTHRRETRHYFGDARPALEREVAKKGKRGKLQRMDGEGSCKEGKEREVAKKGKRGKLQRRQREGSCKDMYMYVCKESCKEVYVRKVARKGGVESCKEREKREVAKGTEGSDKKGRRGK